MYTIAVKYDVSGLKDLACQNFSRSSQKSWDSDDFSVAIGHVFSSTLSKDTGLRSIVIRVISSQTAIVKTAEIQT
ncbi:hypothetical protein G6011_08468 [Alternaria panax]|uniref:Uncharacterized protein n=1 Tax=Alternaria panax TaxID=48097 RepID=A0AAD4I644_9PLEO|nr:hypothetical protein G6011_08468 [Alternaria panax]